MRWRFPPLVSMIIFALAALGLYLVKYQVQAVRDDVSQLEAKLDAEREALALLEAEWAYLNRPDRLVRLGEAHLKMQPPEPEQMVSWQSLPMRPHIIAAQQNGGH